MKMYLKVLYFGSEATDEDRRMADKECRVLW